MSLISISGFHLANQNQLVCVRREAGFCFICFSQVDNVNFMDFGISAGKLIFIQIKLKAIVRQSSSSHQAVLRQFKSLLRQLSKSQQDLIRQTSGSRQSVISQSSGRCQVVVRQLSRHCQKVYRQLSGSHQVVNRQSYEILKYTSKKQANHICVDQTTQEAVSPSGSCQDLSFFVQPMGLRAFSVLLPSVISTFYFRQTQGMLLLQIHRREPI